MYNFEVSLLWFVILFRYGSCFFVKPFFLASTVFWSIFAFITTRWMWRSNCAEFFPCLVQNNILVWFEIVVLIYVHFLLENRLDEKIYDDVIRSVMTYVWLLVLFSVAGESLWRLDHLVQLEDICNPSFRDFFFRTWRGIRNIIRIFCIWEVFLWRTKF